MTFDDPIYLDRTSLELLMDDTDRQRLCWMYHDVLSDPRFGRMFDQYSGGGKSVKDGWTTTAWVAPSQQEDSFYLLFKWYADFYAPPQRGDLYLLERDQSPDGEVRIRHLNMDFQDKMDDRGKAWCRSLWSRVSKNAAAYFGETDFESTVISRILRVVKDHPGRELEAFDWYFGGRGDGEKSRQCAAVSAYFRAILSVQEIVNSMVETDGGVNPVRYMHTGELMEISSRFPSDKQFEEMTRLAGLFHDLSLRFQIGPVPGPILSRVSLRALIGLTQAGKLRWVRLNGSRLLRELYWRTVPGRVWDPYFRWQGDVFFTVIRRPPVPEFQRGVYILSRFEDHTGQDVTGLFWLESGTGGAIRLCGGELLDELMDQLLPVGQRAVAPPGLRWHETEDVNRIMLRLKEVFDKSGRGRY